MITPIGIGYAFRMLADTTKGPVLSGLAVGRTWQFRLGQRPMDGTNIIVVGEFVAVDPVYLRYTPCRLGKRLA